MQDGFKSYNDNKYIQNQELLKQQQEGLKTGEYKPNDMMEGVYNGLRGKQGNAMWMLYKERHNIAKMLEPMSKGDNGKRYIEKLQAEDAKRGWDADMKPLVPKKRFPWSKQPM